MAFRLSILYVGPRCPRDFASAHPFFSFEYIDAPDAITSCKHRPDIVLADPFGQDFDIDQEKAGAWFDTLNGHHFKFSLTIFVIVPEETGKDVRLSLIERGADQVVDWPLDKRELEIKSKSAAQKLALEQNLFTKAGSLEKSFGYLNRFKRELKEVKEALFEDKSNLNTALKQVGQMTEERRRLKQNLADIKAQVASDLQGFGRILYALISQQVEQNRGHGERVGKTACFIAQKMGLSQKQLEDLKKAAMLHETGLLFLSEAYFSRKLAGKEEDGQDLDNPEIYDQSAYDQTLMVQFPVKGAELLDHCRGFEAPAAIIRSMNENVDGSGYPDGLKRHHIPLASRILAAADELETLREKDRFRDVKDLLLGLEPLNGSRLDPVICGWLEKYVLLHLAGDHLSVRGLGLAQLAPGMELGATLYTKTGTKLFAAGTVLTRQTIDKIIQYHREYPVDETVYIVPER